MNLIFSSLLVLVMSYSGLESQSTFRGTVVDSMGAVIGNSYVLIRTDAREREHPTPFERAMRTDREGRFNTSLEPGFYDLFIAASGFAPYCREIRVKDGKPLELRVQLAVDELQVREYGEQFRGR